MAAAASKRAVSTRAGIVYGLAHMQYKFVRFNDGHELAASCCTTTN
jgi:hypothetical protein